MRSVNDCLKSTAKHEDGCLVVFYFRIHSHLLSMLCQFVEVTLFWTCWILKRVKRSTKCRLRHYRATLTKFQFEKLVKYSHFTFNKVSYVLLITSIFIFINY